MSPQPKLDQLLPPAPAAITLPSPSLSTAATLDFALRHAQARDAVHTTLAIPSLLEALRHRNLPTITLKSAASDRATYLRQPHLGRTLSPAAAAALARYPLTPASHPLPVSLLSIILADGLSALAVDRHAIPLLDALLPLLTAFTLTPIVIAEQARVAIGDPIGQTLHADLTLVLIGERPGLSSPDSLGAYLTWAPRPGRTDAERNCISNIHTQGLDYPTAAARIADLCTQALHRQLSGTAIKEISPQPPSTTLP